MKHIDKKSIGTHFVVPMLEKGHATLMLQENHYSIVSIVRVVVKNDPRLFVI